MRSNKETNKNLSLDLKVFKTGEWLEKQKALDMLTANASGKYKGFEIDVLKLIEYLGITHSGGAPIEKIMVFPGNNSNGSENLVIIGYTKNDEPVFHHNAVTDEDEVLEHIDPATVNKPIGLS